MEEQKLKKCNIFFKRGNNLNSLNIKPSIIQNNVILPHKQKKPIQQTTKEQ